MDDDLLGKIFRTIFSVAGWAALCGVIVHWWKSRNERLRDTANEKTSDWSRLRAEITRLDERCDHLQHEVDECRQREAEWMRRAIAAEAASEGIGEARQEAQRIVSTEMQSLKPKGESQ